MKRNNIIKYIIYFAILLVGVLGGNAINLVIRPSVTENVMDSTFSIELAKKNVPSLIETADGLIEVNDYPTVESVDGNNLVGCVEETCGLGHYIYAPVDTWQNFMDYTINKCWNTDDSFGAQCWDLADMYWQNLAGRNFSTCGTGGAKGSWNCKEENAGNEFVLIYDKTELRAGDWVIFNSGKYGHVGMAIGGYNNGYVALLGQNQGGSACDGGGSATNIINISLNSFVGAFRPKIYIEPEPTPEPTPEPVIPVSNCVLWHVAQGDTMSKIMMECENTIQYGEVMDEYAKTWYSLIFRPNQSVYDGWYHSDNGVGLYVDDDIEHRF